MLSNYARTSFQSLLFRAPLPDSLAGTPRMGLHDFLSGKMSTSKIKGLVSQEHYLLPRHLQRIPTVALDSLSS